MSNITDIPFWGIPTASVDWCEKNYEVCMFIAEFWNTITSSLIGIFGLIGAYLTIRERIERRFTVLYLIIILVGLGSVAFHGTLLLEYQLLDELPMLWGMMGWVFIIYRMESPRSTTKEDRRLALILSVISIVWTVFARRIHSDYPVIFQGTFVLLVAFCCLNLHKFYHVCKNPTARMLYIVYNLSVGVGAGLWLLDKHACTALHNTLGKYWWHQYFGSFHGYWHTLMAANVYVGPVFAATVRSEILGSKSKIEWFMGMFPYLGRDKPSRLQSGGKTE